MQQLHVKVIEAKGVPKMDIIGKADPYVLLQLTGSSKVFKTKVCDRTYEPKWNQEYTFTIPSGTETLHLLMKDKDVISQDDPISKLEIPINSLKNGEILDKWYDMRPMPGVPKGCKIHLVTHLCNQGEKAWEKRPKINQNQAQINPNQMQNMQMQYNQSNYQMQQPMMNQQFQYTPQQIPPQMMIQQPQYQYQQQFPHQQQMMMINGYPQQPFQQQPMMMNSYQQQPPMMIGGYPQQQPQQYQMGQGYFPQQQQMANGRPYY